MQQYECILSARYLLPSGQRAERVVLQLVLCRASISSGLVKYNAVRMYIRTHARIYGCKCKQRTLKRAASNYLARCVYAQVLDVFRRWTIAACTASRMAPAEAIIDRGVVHACRIWPVSICIILSITWNHHHQIRQSYDIRRLRLSRGEFHAKLGSMESSYEFCSRSRCRSFAAGPIKKYNKHHNKKHNKQR